MAAEPGASILDIQYGGRVIFVFSDDQDFAKKLHNVGAIYVFDAIAAGCHTKATETKHVVARKQHFVSYGGVIPLRDLGPVLSDVS